MTRLTVVGGESARKFWSSWEFMAKCRWIVASRLRGTGGMKYLGEEAEAVVHREARLATRGVDAADQ